MDVKNFEAAVRQLGKGGKTVSLHNMSLDRGQVTAAIGSSPEYEMIFWDGFGRAFVQREVRLENMMVADGGEGAYLIRSTPVMRYEPYDLKLEEQP